MASGSEGKQPVKNASLVGGGSSLKEGLFGIGCGILYGMTSPLVGHPLDTVKTKMQAQNGYVKGGMILTLRNVIRNEGFFALYKGLLPPLIGSSIFRSVQFGAYGASYAGMRNSELMTSDIPGTGGLQPRVLVAGFVSALSRSLLETPLELMKVRRQTGQTWRVGTSPLNTVSGWRELLSVPQVRELYKGIGVSFWRTWGLMGSFFIMVDYATRYIPEFINTPLVGPFFKGGVCATAGWWIVWPMEVMKNQVQANYGNSQLPWVRRASLVLKDTGVTGLYRGIAPGTVRSLIANGCSMVVFSWCQNTRIQMEQARLERESGTESQCYK